MDPHLENLSNLVTTYLTEGSGLLLACSGGSDSQCLLDLFGRLQTKVEIGPLVAVGLDHGLRPEASAELDLAEKLAKTHNIAFERRTLNLPKAGNLMENARNARYSMLRKIAIEHRIPFIATGHTSTDQAETILFNLARGSGPAGASGMQTLTGDIFRPLLGLSRQETQAYVQKESIPFASDPTNANPRYTRVFLRQTVLPALTRVSSKASDNISFFGTLINEDNNYLDQEAAQVLSKTKGLLNSLSLEGLTDTPTPILRRVIRLWACGHGLSCDRDTSIALFEAVRAQRPWKRSSGRDTVLEIAGNHLWCDRKFDGYAMPLEPKTTTKIPLFNFDLDSAPYDPPQVTELTRILGNNHQTEVAFDADQLHLDLQVRTWKKNDRIQLFGAKGHSTLGDLFTNARIPGPLRKRWPLVVGGSDGSEILWVPGIKRGAQAPLTGATQRCLRLKMSGKIWPTGQ